MKLKELQIKLKSLLSPNINYDNLIVQLGLNQSCNGKCKFCSINKLIEAETQKMPKKWIYEYLKPLYPKMSLMSLTFGEATMYEDNFEFAKWICENYKNITLLIETNGIAFDEKWQKLACENLFFVHFSLNSISPELYQETVWDAPEGGDVAYKKIINNFENYLKLLKEKNMEEFNPSCSMVINKDTYKQTFDFLEMAMKYKVKYCCLFLDAKETELREENNEYSKDIYEIIKNLLEIERLIYDKFFINFKLFIPEEKLSSLEKEVYEEDIEELKIKHKKYVELAKDRDIWAEYYKRKGKREKDGKKPLELGEDFRLVTPLHKNNDGKLVCFSPWKQIRIMPSGLIDMCLFRWDEKIRIQNIKNSWNKVFNGFWYKYHRSIFEKCNYRGCPQNCAQKYQTNNYKFLENKELRR